MEMIDPSEHSFARFVSFSDTFKHDGDKAPEKRPWLSPLLAKIVNMNVDEEDPPEDTDESHPRKSTTTVFLTGSCHEGSWNKMDRMEGEGHYVFPHNSGFKGSFEDGQFKEGCYYFPMGQSIDGYQQHNYVRFADGLMFSEKFKYCHTADRRYLATICKGFKPAGEERTTGGAVDRPIPEGCYDTGDGFYNPYTKCVVSALDNSTVLRIPTKTEEIWILAHCRKGWDEPVGYRPGLFERWTTGLSDEPTECGSNASLAASMRTDTDLHIDANQSSMYIDVDELLKRERELGNLD